MGLFNQTALFNTCQITIEITLYTLTVSLL